MFYTSIAMVFIVIIFGAVSYSYYSFCYNSVARQLPELIRIVAEDNCLDNTISYDGQTAYQAYKSKLTTLASNNSSIKFPSNCIEVTYNGVEQYDRSTAPQKCSVVKVTLRANISFKFPAFDKTLSFDREFTEPVLCTRYYRDR